MTLSSQLFMNLFHILTTLLFVALTNSLSLIFDLLHDRQLRLFLPSFALVIFQFVNMIVERKILKNYKKINI